MTDAGPVVGVVMGSTSDMPTMSAAIEILQEFDVPLEVRILSAHRTPDAMFAYARAAAARGVKVIIAGAGGAAHLPGMVASATALPVIGVPVVATALAGIDALLSIVQMPAGIPVATVAIGNAKNAGLLAVRILGTSDATVQQRMDAYQRNLAEKVAAADQEVQASFAVSPPNECLHQITRWPMVWTHRAGVARWLEM